MFEHVWVRLLTASLLLGWYGMAGTMARWFGRRRGIPRVRRPLWSHLLGFFSLLSFYAQIPKDGRAVLGGLGNEIGVVVAVLALALGWRKHGSNRYPDLISHMLFFAALPLAVGSPRSLLWLTLPQAVVAGYTARQRDTALGAPTRAGAPR